MYKRHAECKHWKLELLTASPTELGGFKEITLALEGEGVYRELQYESGGHRVQRVPETEAKGRIHTSAATVAVLPEPEDVEVDVKPDDYRKDIFHASGPGGQHVNKTASAIRLTHYDSGSSSPFKMKRASIRTSQRRCGYSSQDCTIAINKKNKRSVRMNARAWSDRAIAVAHPHVQLSGEPRNRPPDQLTLYKLDQIIAGNLEPITQALIDHDRQELRSSMGHLD